MDSKIERVPQRDGYGKGLLELCRDNDKIMVLDADVSASTRTSARSFSATGVVMKKSQGFTYTGPPTHRQTSRYKPPPLYQREEG